MKNILVTGSAGFIGYYLCRRLLDEGFKVGSVDNLNSYYDVKLKEDRLAELKKYDNFSFVKCDLADFEGLKAVFCDVKPEIVVNLAAQAGVRYSIDNPRAYIDSNLVGFFNVLELVRHSEELWGNKVEHLVYASSSSVYGLGCEAPYSVEQKADKPVSLYAATKKSNELMAYSYSKLYGIPSTGLRFFTVYGPLGRPDMAYYKFTNLLTAGKSIQLYNHGDMLRDFTYIDDIIEGIVRVMGKAPDPDRYGVNFKVYNIGGSKPEKLEYFVDTLEKLLLKEGVIEKPAEREYLPMQPGDVYSTCADPCGLLEDFGFKPEISLEEGLEKFVKWYKSYYV